MEFMDVITARKSVRSYLDKPIEEEKLAEILEAARLAPSWANKQCCKYIVVKDKAKIQELAGSFRAWLKQAPVIVVACADPKNSGSHDGMDYYLIDIGISLQQLILAATNLGFGTCWIGSFDEAKIKKVLEVPDPVKVVAMTPIGYPEDKADVGTKAVKAHFGSAKRKPLADMVHWEKW